MSSIIKLLRKIGGPKATPTTGSAGELAIWKAGAKTTDAMSLYAHDGTQWIEVIDTRGQVVAPKLTTIATTAPGTPQPGDMWLNTATNLLSIWDGATWCTTDTHQAATSVLAPVNPTTGSMWLDPGKKDLMVWDGSQWANVAFKNVTNTFTQPQNIDVNSTSPALRITQAITGAGLAVDKIVAAGAAKSVAIENINISDDGAGNAQLTSSDTLLINSPKQVVLLSRSAATQGLTLYPNGDTTLGHGGAEGRFTVSQDVAGGNAMTIHCTASAGPNYGLNIRSVANAANTPALIRAHSSETNLVFSVNGAGVIASTSTSIVGVSDAKHKENVRDLDVGLAEVMKLKPRRFDWKATAPASGHNLVGFVAQEVEKVMPELVTDWHPDPMGDPNTTTKALKMGDMIPALVKAIQEQQKRIEALEARP